MARQLLLHIGTHKTGTTSIQKFFANEPISAKNEGIIYPKSPRPDRAPNGHHNLPWSLMEAGRKNFELPGVEVWDQTLSEIETANPQATLLSSEEFSFLRGEEVGRVKEQLSSFDTKVVVYLRNPLTFMVSLYKQRIKGGVVKKKFSEFIRSAHHLCHYQEIVSPWQDVFGKENVILRCFETERKRDGGMIASIVQELGVKDPTAIIAEEKSATVMNTSPTDRAIQLVRWINESQAKHSGKLGDFLGRLRASVLDGGFLGSLILGLSKPFIASDLATKEDADALRESTSFWREAFLGEYFSEAEIRAFDF